MRYGKKVFSKDFALDKEGLILIRPDTDFKDSLFVRGNLNNINPNLFNIIKGSFTI